MTTLLADYVVYGAGAMGMAFVDVLVTETKATVVLVDEHSQPGGHWNDAYPFVRLHQPSAFYGVNSRRLERSDNLLELASGNEVLAYYEAVIESFIRSGRVQYFPMCRCDDRTSRRFRSLVEPGKSYQVAHDAKIVDATYMRVEVPSVSHPARHGRYDVEDGVDLIPINALTKAGSARNSYIIIGAGKTGMDAVLWLRGQGVDSGRIVWVMPRDPWIINRDIFSLTQRFNDISGIDLVKLTQGPTLATSVEDYYLRMERAGLWCRLDASVLPTRNKCATVSPEEMELLRSVKNVLRLGRLARVEKSKLVFASGEIVHTSGDALHVDCTTDALSRRPETPVFSGNMITLQTLTTCQQVFSAAVIGHLEARGGTDAAKKSLSIPAPHPEKPDHFLISQLVALKNKQAWRSDADMASWLKHARLFGETSIAKKADRWKGLTWALSNPRKLYSLMRLPLVGDKASEIVSLERIVSKL